MLLGMVVDQAKRQTIRIENYLQILFLLESREFDEDELLA